jgi:VWFA-related protein
MKALASCLVLLVLGGLEGLGQQASQRPSFRSGVDIVAVDFLALGPDGRPVPDLRPEDLTLRVGGRPREIKSLQFVRLASPDPGESFPMAPLPYGSNRLEDAGRTFVLVVDHESIAPGKEATLRRAAARFLTRLTPRDSVALLTVPRGGIVVGLTRDHHKVHEGISRVTGLSPRTQSGSDEACRSRESLMALTGLLDGLALIDGPKALIYMSSGLMPPRRDAPLNAPPGPCEIQPEHFQTVGRAANVVRTHFYVVQSDEFKMDTGRRPPDTSRLPPRGNPDPGVQAFADPTESRFAIADDLMTGLRNLAGVTGGEMYKIGGNLEDPFARIARESSGYYLLGFEPDPSERDGSSRRIELRLSRPDVTVRARPDFTISRQDPRRKEASPREMLREARLYRDLPLLVVGYASRMPGEAKLKILAVAQPLEPDVPLKAASMALIDAKGKVVSQWTATSQELSSLPLVCALEGVPGSYRLRIAATDESGRRGAADYEFWAELTAAGPLKLSGIALGVQANNSFAPKLQFGADPLAIAYFEIYGPPRAASVQIILELAETPNGPSLATLPVKIMETGEEDRRIALAGIPVANLPPGEFVVRAVAMVNGQPTARVFRTLHKTGT